MRENENPCIYVTCRGFALRTGSRRGTAGTAADCPARGSPVLKSNFLKVCWQQTKNDKNSLIMIEIVILTRWSPDINAADGSMAYGKGDGFLGKYKTINYKCFLKGLFFVLLFLAGLKGAVLLLYPPNEIIRTWHCFYALEKGEAEVLVVGSSHAYSTFDPWVISQSTGMSSYVLASNSQNTVQAYFNVKEALHYQQPKAIILEAFSLDNNNNFRYGDTPDRDWKKKANIDGMRFGLTKLEAVMEQYEGRNWSYALLPIARCHSNWTDIVSIGSNLNFYMKGIRNFSSFRPSRTSMSADTQRLYAEADYNPAEWVISGSNELYFHKLAQLCREEGIPFYVVMAPMYDVYIRSINYDSCFEKISSLAESEGVYYLDCNRHYNEIGLTAQDFEDAFNGYHHLNGSGAEKVTRFVMDMLYVQEKE